MNSSTPSASSDDERRPAAAVQRIAVIDHHAVVRAGLARILEDMVGVTVVGQGGSAAAAFALIDEKHPDIVILDDSLPDMDGPGAITTILEHDENACVLILSKHESPDYAVRAMRAGAQGFLLKSDGVREIELAIRSAAVGGTFISPRLREAVTTLLRTPTAARTGIASLSTREFQLLHHIVLGNSLQEASRTMNVSESSVSTYRRRLLDKLQVANNAQLVRYALEHGIDGEGAAPAGE